MHAGHTSRATRPEKQTALDPHSDLACIRPVEQVEVEIILEQGCGKDAVWIGRQPLTFLLLLLVDVGIGIIVFLLVDFISELEYFGDDFGCEESLAE